MLDFTVAGQKWTLYKCQELAEGKLEETRYTLARKIKKIHLAVLNVNQREISLRLPWIVPVRLTQETPRINY
jgi:hypothetical protein